MPIRPSKPVPVPNKKRGFTLIELAIVLVIIGMAAAIAFPKLAGGLVEHERLRSQANAAAVLAMQARNLAATTGTVQLLVVDQQSGTLQVAQSRLQQKETGSGPDSSLQRKLSGGIKIASVRCESKKPAEQSGTTVAGTVIRFYPEGTADAAEIAFADDRGNVAVVNIDPLTGRATITDAAQTRPTDNFSAAADAYSPAGNAYVD